MVALCSCAWDELSGAQHASDVIVEWHHAINWPIGYLDAGWDEAPIDT